MARQLPGTLIFRTRMAAYCYKNCCGKWYGEHHHVVEGTIGGHHVGYVLRLVNTKYPKDAKRKAIT